MIINVGGILLRETLMVKLFQYGQNCCLIEDQHCQQINLCISYGIKLYLSETKLSLFDDI